MDNGSQLLTDATLFHRTEKGLGEIHHKAPGLTQSERLLLIIIDGITDYSGLREKLKGLAHARFNTALLGLLKKGLIEELDSTRAIQIAEKFDSNVVSEFLQRDPLDPITIVPLNSSDTYLDESTEAVFRIPGNNQLPPPPENGDVLRVSKVAKVDFYLPLEMPVKEARTDRLSGRSSGVRTSMRSRGGGKKKSRGVQANYFRYWVIFLIVTLVILFVIFLVSR